MDGQWKQTTKDSYENHAQEFASFASIFRGKLEQFISQFAATVTKGGHVLDVGCGAGRDARFFVDKGLQVTGIDFSEELIKICQQKIPDGKFIVMDFEEIDFPKDHFDGVWASASLLHVPKDHLPVVLEKIFTVIKPNGVFFAAFREGTDEKMTTEKRGEAFLERFYAYYSIEELKKLFKKAGFTNIGVELDTIETGKWILIQGKK